MSVTIKEYGSDFIYGVFDMAFEGIRPYLLLYFIGILLLIIYKKDDLKSVFLHPIIALCLTAYNPYIMFYVMEKINLEIRFARMFWIIPLALFMAYLLTSLIFSVSKLSLKILVAAMSVAFVAIAGNLSSDGTNIATNIYKLDNESLQVHDLIKEDCGKDKEAVLLASEAGLYRIRELDPSLKMALERSYVRTFEYTDDEQLQRLIEKKNYSGLLATTVRFGIIFDEVLFRESIAKKQVDYLVINQKLQLDDYFWSLGYTRLGTTDNYSVFKIVS
ncbi:hypothetical protein SAMN05216249_10140 [Acetitomaculum ruminis DSM 5522]|uniref:Uncharacterized protein n=1 Tax=Acetitomaculum ruminis DSM 5522 TaxID=1120918 RepID=A0A1I0UY19_9FIRM|nr:hypothetical protein [Acetitomaculum ruminis]SFA68948.1 hypothetical protein SAMN05216249_10140 [Acetitomaculum ruminis DSM 5522]